MTGEITRTRQVDDAGPDPGGREHEIRGTTQGVDRTPEGEEVRPGYGRAGDVAATRRYVDRVVGLYLLASALWIGAGGVAADWVADLTGASLVAIELSKGLLFVVVTAVVLRSALRRWAGRTMRAAEAERLAAERTRETEQARARFVSSISHELRTPLTNIVGYAITLQEFGARTDGETRDRFLDRLVVNARRLERQIVNLLEVGVSVERDALVVDPIRLDELVDDVVAGLAVPTHQIDIVVDATEVMLDRDRIRRIVRELVHNAIVHTAEGTTITIRGSVSDTTIGITVEDDGDGVDPGLHREMFEPFAQGPDADASPSPGIGVGLAAANRAAVVHGGEIRFEPRPGGGARFVVTIPRRAGSRLS